MFETGSSRRWRVSRAALILAQVVFLCVSLLGPAFVSAADQSPDPSASPPPSAEPSTEPTPSADPSPEPSVEPTADPTPAPTPDPTPDPTPAPTPDPTPAPTPDPTPAPTPDPTPAPVLHSYIVSFASGVSSAEQIAALTAAGTTSRDSIAVLRMHTVDASDASVALLRADARVATVELDRTRATESTPDDASYADQWSLAKIGWDQAYGVVDPAGTSVVAILDTGVDASHPDLDGNVVSGASFVDGAAWSSDPNGHGTAMAGIVAAETGNGVGIAGVGYDGVSVMPITVLGADGTGQDSDIIEGVVWAADHGADVILMSFSAAGYSSALQAAIDYAWSNGVVLVAAAGNDGSSSPAFPAGDRGVIGVSNTDSSDALAAGSNYGASVFLGAPGVGILTTEGGGYSTISGTSASAAHVAGVAALLAADDPSASNGTIVGRLARNADAAGAVAETGNGRLNVARALADTATDAVEPSGAAPVGDGGPFVGPYVVAANNADLWLWKNVGGSQWVTNTLATGDNDYHNGDVIPGRLQLKQLTQGTTWTVTLKYDFSSGADRFIDSLTTFNQTEPLTTTPAGTSQACGQLSGGTCTSGPNAFPIPTDGTLPAGAQIPGNFMTYNGSITSTTSYSLISDQKLITISGTVISDTNANKKFDVVVVYGLHLARDNEWGANNGAVTFPGASRKQYWENCSCGNPDGSQSINIAGAPGNAFADLSVTKSDTPDPIIAGDTLTYTVGVTNLGPNQAPGVTVTDPLPNVPPQLISATKTWTKTSPAGSGTCIGTTTVSCVIGALDAGASATITITAVVPANTASGTLLTNTATATVTGAGFGGDPVSGNNSAQTTTTVRGRADVSVTKTDSPDPVTVGGNLTYSIVVKNESTTTTGSTATGIQVTDPLPANTTLVSATGTAGVSCTGTTTVTCSVPNLAPLATATITIVVNVLPLAGGTTLSNIASVTSTTFDPAAANDSSTATTTVNASADLSITKSDSDDPVNPSQLFNYSIVVTNNGPTAAVNVHVDDLVPSAFTVTGTPTATAGSCTATGNDVDCNLALLPATLGLNTWTITIPVTVTTTTEGTHNNTATVLSATSDPTPGNNSDTEPTTIDVLPDISVTKSPNPTSVPETGGSVAFTVSVKNNTTEMVTITTLTDSDFGNLAGQGTCATGGTIAAGATYTCTFTQTISGDFGGPSHQNTATATVTDNEANTDTESGSATVPFSDVPTDISVTKVADATLVPETGQSVLFTFTVTNNINEPATIASLSDSVYGPLSGDADCQVGTILAPFASCDFSITRFVSGDASGPDHSNTFTASATDNEANTDTATATATIDFSDVPTDISVTKVADATLVPETGQSVLFTFTVTNNINEPATIASLSDSVYGPLSGDADCQVGTILAPFASCDFSITRFVSGDASGPDHSNTFTASATDNEANTDTATATATIDFSDVLPSVTLDKSVVPASRPEPGGMFTYTLKITNTSLEAAVITSLTDSNTLGAGCLALVSTTLAGGASVSCTYAATYTNAGAYGNTANVTVGDNDGNSATGTDSETATVTDVVPTIDVVKTAGSALDGNDYHINEPGGWVTFTVKITNTSTSGDPVKATSITDSINGGVPTPLSPSCTRSGGSPFSIATDWIAPGETITCTYSRNVVGDGPYTETNVVSVIAADDDLGGTDATDSDSAVVKIDNVAPSVSLTGPASVSESAVTEHLYTFETTDPGTPDTFTAGTPNCGSGTFVVGSLVFSTTTGDGSFKCKFLDDVGAGSPNNTTVSITITDDDAGAGTGSQLVTVNNVVPVVTIVGPPSGSAYAVGTPVTFSGSFTDVGISDTHGAIWKFDAITAPGIVVQGSGSGTVSGTYTFTTPGVYNIILEVTDDDGGIGSANTVNGLPARIVIYDSNAGFVTGGGYVTHQANWTSPPIAGTGKDNYGFVAKYKKGASAPDGETEFQCKDCNINFHSTSLDWLIVTSITSGPNAGAQKAWYQGSGTINGAGSYGFQVTVIDKGNVDYFRIKIWEKANPSNVRYDNMPAMADGADPITLAQGGNIVIHK